jgi:hypothetical protein
MIIILFFRFLSQFRKDIRKVCYFKLFSFDKYLLEFCHIIMFEHYVIVLKSNAEYMLYFANSPFRP